jgi:hypothetical protein
MKVAKVHLSMTHWFPGEPHIRAACRMSNARMTDHIEDVTCGQCLRSKYAKHKIELKTRMSR